MFPFIIQKPKTLKKLVQDIIAETGDEKFAEILNLSEDELKKVFEMYADNIRWERTSTWYPSSVMEDSDMSPKEMLQMLLEADSGEPLEEEDPDENEGKFICEACTSELYCHPLYHIYTKHYLK